MRAQRPTRRILAAALTSLLLLGAALPASAEGWFPDVDLGWEGSTAQQATAKGIDVVLVRPLATARVIVGSLIFLPSALLASPMGRSGIDGAYEVLIEIPAEYAFEREIGEF